MSTCPTCGAPVSGVIYKNTALIEATTRLTEQAAEIERLKGERNDAKKIATEFMLGAGEELKRAEAAEARLAEAERLLVPFVKEFEERRDAYIRRYPRHPAVGAQNFDKMPDEWPMEKCIFSMGVFRAARAFLNKDPDHANG